MARMIDLHRRSFPGFDQWCAGALPRIPEDQPAVWRALLNNTPDVAATDVAAAIRAGQDPIIWVTPMPGLFGMFDPARPNVISIARRLLDDSASREIEPTIMHELVHWAWHRTGRPEPEEMGRKFEREAYPGRPGIELAEEIAREIDPAGGDLGALSRSYESNGKPWAIGHDTTGGWSYGLYQLAARQGSVARFVTFLGRSGDPQWQAYAARLHDAGGDAGARDGSLTFQAAWRALAEDAAFSRAQHDFIKATHYDPFVRNLIAEGFDVERRAAVLGDVAWSVSVQHGPGATAVFTRSLANLTPAERADDAELIRAIYRERSRVDVYFARSTPQVKEAVTTRFARECAQALTLV